MLVHILESKKSKSLLHLDQRGNALTVYKTSYESSNAVREFTDRFKTYESKHEPKVPKPNF